VDARRWTHGHCQLVPAALTQPCFPATESLINNPCKTWLPSFGPLTSSTAISTLLYLTFLLMFLYPQLAFLSCPR